MLGRMSSAEVADWMAYERITGPLGPERADHLAAFSAAVVLKAAGAKRVKVADLVPRWDTPEPMRWQDIRQSLVMLTHAAGGQVIDQ